MILYHGSYCKVENPLLEKCAANKDFGRGFYLTSSKEQAVSFLRTSIYKAIANESISEGQDFGFVSSFEFSLIPELNVYSFKSADIEWLHCVASHRTENAFAEIHDRMKKYDLITGKIANDATNTTLTAYISGAYGQMGTSDADEFCIKRLLPNKLQDQFCFRTEKALKCLAFIKAEKIWLR